MEEIPMNYGVIITETKSSREYLARKIEWVLDLLDKEHHHCDTHSQRNMYQAVIRHEMEIIRDELRYANEPGGASQSDQIPF
jgi:hypothetical protein